jgi:pyruvate dehydrogenase E1 component alpha subunit
VRQILAPDGTLAAESPLPTEHVKRLFEAMVTARRYDHKSISLQRQGRLATYAPFEGQEAAQLASVACLRPDDWLVATYRDAAAMWAHGYPMSLLFLGRVGDERGGSVPDDVFCLPPSITVGGHMIHAVGLAWASSLQDEQRVALTMFGDGATSEGDFHEAMNFAAVYETPTVFFCQNNGYAISLPVDRQTRSETIAVKADAYGMPGVRVDGNDPLAVYEVTREAVARARSGDGPTLIEALTYRVGPHTTNDDPGRYRDGSEEVAAKERDPLARTRRYLQALGEWDEEWERQVEQAADELVEAAIGDAESTPLPDTAHVFAGMFAEPHADLRSQMEEADRG